MIFEGSFQTKPFCDSRKILSLTPHFCQTHHQVVLQQDVEQHISCKMALELLAAVEGVVFLGVARGPCWVQRARQDTAASIPSWISTCASGFLLEGIHWPVLKETPGTNFPIHSTEN